ncbi:hypothetical protein CLF_113165 [Clonorchis sinensis]|uniref:Endonuclease/exonuclease/phosphatase domain-containing protein n=1 Tax=Clonorchis sinensis TaxID=79923 RepID=G7YXS9_CLOSI|nr:hypothetical protein CLF_113165 [Clonorchis sinensis]
MVSWNATVSDVVPTYFLRRKLIVECRQMAHKGCAKTYDLILHRSYWPKMEANRRLAYTRYRSETWIVADNTPVSGKKLRSPKVSAPSKPDSHGAKKPANEKQLTKPPSEEADKYASEVPSEPSTQTRRTAIKSANRPYYTTLGSSPSEAAETVLKCLSTNCLSLFNKLCDIKQSVCLEQPSIIALTETWLTPDVSDVISINGYSIFRADSKRGRAGGVALYLHAALPIPIALSDTTPAPLCKALWIQVSLRGSDSLLGVVYRCLLSSPEDDQFLIRTLEQLSSSYHFTRRLLVGDFNAPKASLMELQRVESSRLFAVALTEVVQQSAWTQHVFATTRYHVGQQPSLLDLVYTNEIHFADQVIINTPLGHSDHRVLTFDVIGFWARNHEPQTWIGKFCRADFSEMRIFLDQVKLGPVSVEDLYRTTSLTRCWLKNQHVVRKFRRKSYVSISDVKIQGTWNIERYISIRLSSFDFYKRVSALLKTEHLVSGVDQTYKRPVAEKDRGETSKTEANATPCHRETNNNRSCPAKLQLASGGFHRSTARLPIYMDFGEALSYIDKTALPDPI